LPATIHNGMPRGAYRSRLNVPNTRVQFCGFSRFFRVPASLGDDHFLPAPSRKSGQDQ
jgi:hypothetical protein